MIALYCRLSVADGTEGESDSIANQRLLLADFLASRDDLAGEDHMFFVDDGISGTHAENRPALQKMLRCCREGKVSAVVVKDLSRLSRDSLYCVRLVEDELPSLGVRVIAVTDNYDSKRDGGSPAAGTDLGFKAIMNAWYSKDLSRKINQSIRSERSRGVNINTVPFGYRKKRGAGACEVDEEGAAVVRRIFELALEGLDQSRIAAVLNDEGAVTPHNLKAMRSRGGRTEFKAYQRWSGKMVKHIVRNPHYKGTLVLGKRKRVEMGLPASRRTDPDERLVFEDAHEAIVRPKDWERAQKAMRDTNCGGKVEPLGHPFAGYLFCPLCGNAIPFRKGRGEMADGRYIAGCECRPAPPSISLCDLERAVRSVVRAHADLLLGLSEAVEAAREAPGRMAELRLSLRRLSARKLRAYEAYREEGGDPGLLAAKMRAIRSEEEAARCALERMEGDADRRAFALIDAERALELAGRLGERWETREALEAFVERIELVGDDDVRIFFKYDDLFDRLAGS